MSNSVTQSQKTVSSVCPYCGVGCGILLETDGKKVFKVTGNKNHPTNFGRLCTKGSSSAQVLRDSGRMENAFLRNERGRDPVQISMDEAITSTAKRLRRIVDQHGADAVSLYVSGQLSLEAQYLANKLAKGFIGTNNIESNSRLCMASAGSGYKLSLGADGPPGSYEDFDQADVFLVIGSNMADCHPILFLRMMERVKQGAKLIVVDPRRTATADKADLFLQIKPGTDLALLNGLLYLLRDNNDLNSAFIEEFTHGWQAMPEFLQDYSPEKVASITGLAIADIAKAARWIGSTQAFMSCWTMGLNQSTHGTWHTNAICNLHLATGTICRPGAGPFSLTGQPNAMGGREMGYMGAGLPGQRSLLSERDRERVEQLWHLPKGQLKTDLGQGTIDLFERMAAGEIKACWIICTNPVASVPNRQTVIDALNHAELVITQDAFLDTETNRYADILLPGALWAEAEGVMINSERTLNLMQKAIDPPGEALPDWQIIARVACEMGYEQAFTYASAEEVFEEIKAFANPDTGYDLRGASYARLRKTPLQWPCAPGTDNNRNPVRYLNNGIHQPLKTTHKGKIPALVFPTDSGKANFFGRPYLPPAELPDDDFPLVLNTGRLQHQWHTLTKTGKVATLNKLNPGPFVEVHPQDAHALGIKEKDTVEIRSRRGYVMLPAVITERVLPGNCFAPFHWSDVFGENLALNALTNDAVDPISQQPEMKFCAVALKRVALIARDSDSEERTAAAEPRAQVGAFAPLSEQVSGKLIQTFTRETGMNQNSTHVRRPEFSAVEQQYLGGYISGLQASASSITAVPTLPFDAPIEESKRLWVNGLLAGLFSRTLPLDVTQGENHQSAIRLLWASQTGNAETLAESFAAQLSEAGWQVNVQDMDTCNADALCDDEMLLVISSTFGDGDSPDNGQGFWQQLQSADAPRLDHLNYAVLALGDSSYAQFCGHGKKLDAQLRTLGAKPLLERVDCDADFEAPAAQWLTALKSQLTQIKSTNEQPRATAITPTSIPVSTPAPRFTKAKPFPAQIIINQRLNSEGATKDTRQIAFDLAQSGLAYEAGDALGVRPKNCPELVLELEQLLRLNAEAPVLVDAFERPLRQSLLEDFEICRPSREMLKFIADRSGKRELQTLLLPDRQAELQQWLWGRQLVDVLHDFSITCSGDELVAMLKPLQPRLYSISSSAKMFAAQIHLTIATVRYTRYQQGKKIRKGVSSTFLADRAEGTDVPIFVQTNKNFRVPAEGSAPVIMVGPGTGIAPFRGFLQERRARGDSGKNWLFFGEQHQQSDFYYRDELLDYKNDGLLTNLSLAFSRDQAQKIYVQDRLREHAAEIWRWLEEGAYFYVCGDASRMAKDVDHALREIVQQHGGFNDVDTVNYMRKLNMQKRYLRDVY